MLIFCRVIFQHVDLRINLLFPIFVKIKAVPRPDSTPGDGLYELFTLFYFNSL